MRERVALFGGELSARSRPDHGYEVRARIPLETAA
jgi:signal transduction histidine kinase